MRLAVLAAIVFGFLIILQSVGAIGISPARIEIPFEPNYVADYQFVVLNNLGSEISVEVYKTGNLSEFITLSGPTKFTLGPGQTKSLSFRLALPADLGQPGKHEGLVGTVEGPPQTVGEGAVLGAKAAVEMQVWVYVPYPGKYAQIDLQAQDAEVGRPVNFLVKVRNLGTEAIQASDKIEIFEDETKVATVTADQTLSLSSGESGEMAASWTGQRAGIYRAIATVNYDGKQAMAETNFRVGQLLLEIVALPKTTVQEDQIAELTPTVVSRWNDDIKGVYADIEIIKNGNVVAKGRSEPFDVGPWESKSFSVFIKTEGLAVGIYDARLTVYYAGQTVSRQFAGILEIKRPEVPQLPEILLVLVIAIIIILIILAVVLIVVRRAKRHGKKGKKR